MAGRVVDSNRETRERELGSIEQRLYVVGLSPARLRSKLLFEHRDHHRVQQGERVRQSIAVLAVDVGRNAAGTANRCHGVDVVEVPMREQHGGRAHAVVPQSAVEGVDDADAWVDDQAFLPGGRREHITVGAERGSRNGEDEHSGRLLVSPTRLRFDAIS